MAGFPVFSDPMQVVGRVLVDNGAGVLAEYPVKQVILNVTTLGPNTIIAGVGGARITVIAQDLNLSLNATLEWRSNTTPIIQAFQIVAGNYFRNYLPGYGLRVTAAGNALTLLQTQAVVSTIRGTLYYIEYTGI